MAEAILFLDIDGVIRTLQDHRRPYIPQGVPSYTPSCIVALNTIIYRTDCHLVVSSTWRDVGMQKLRTYFDKWGICKWPMSFTPRFTVDYRKPYRRILRGEEIHAWMEIARQRHKMPRRFLILDDEDDMGCYRPYLIQTSYETGLVMAHAEQAIAYLRKEAEVADG